jgi:hypothetical protein
MQVTRDVIQTPDSKRAIIAAVELEMWKNITHYHTTIGTQKLVLMSVGDTT